MLKLNFVGVFAIFNRAEILAYTETYEQPCKQISMILPKLPKKSSQTHMSLLVTKRRLLELTRKSLVAKRFV